jgi:putative ABC transport system permease protein
MRERIPEFAVLKTLGFSDHGVLGLVLAEAVLLCTAAGAAGLGLVRLAAPLLAPMLPVNASAILLVPWQTAFVGLFFALLMAGLSGFLPALRVKRLNVVDALANR